MRRKLIAGNWKMHNTLPEARALMHGIRERLDTSRAVDVAVFPPYTLLYPMGKEIAGTPIQLGGQNCHYERKGAFTGEISPAMLVAAGCTCVLVGHSERRHIFAEGGDLLSRKVTAALDAGLHVIYCVGEKLEQRQAGQTEHVIGRQCSEAIHAELDASRITLAYEPVWAIGTGHNATPEQAQAAHQFLRSRIETVFGPHVAAQMRIVYGGSVKSSNAAGLLAQPDVDGALVGGACLDAAEFAAIMAAAAAGSAGVLAR